MNFDSLHLRRVVTHSSRMVHVCDGVSGVYSSVCVLYCFIAFLEYQNGPFAGGGSVCAAAWAFLDPISSDGHM